MHGVEATQRRKRQDGPIATLLLLNGPPGVGKSTLAARHLAGRPDARCVEVDRLRMLLDGWEDDESTRLTARDLALAAVEESLLDGLDVVVPQYLGRPDFIDELAAVARSTGARFVEVVVTDDPATIVERFARRRAELAAVGTRHPEGEISDIAAAVADACSRLDALTAARPGTVTLSLAHGPDAALEQLAALIRSG